MIVVPALKVAFQGVPKVGTTSVYLWMFDLCALLDHNALKHTKRGREYFVRREDGNHEVENEPALIAPYADYFKFGFYRDPIKRFLSMYRNRVVYHRELSPKSKAAPLLEANGLSFNPQLNEMVDRLEQYMASAKSIHHHARPQIDFLGPDTSVYDRLVDIRELGQVLEEMRGHWQALGMQTLATHTVALGREQTGGPKLGLEAFSPESIEKLLAFYRSDYQSLDTLSVDAIRAEYQAAVQSKPPAAPVIFWDRPAGEHPAKSPKPHESKAKDAKAAAPKTDHASAKPAKAKAGASGASGGAKTDAAAAAPVGTAEAPAVRLTFKKETVSEVELLRADFPRGATAAGEVFALGGQCLLASELPVSEYALRVRWPGNLKECAWELASPGLVEKYPQNKNAGNARFKVTGVSLQPGERAELLLRRKESDDERLIALLAVELAA